MPEPAPCKPRLRSSGSSVGRAPDFGYTARFLRERAIAAEKEKTPSSARDQKRKGKETWGRVLTAPSLAPRPAGGRHAFGVEYSTALPGLPIQPVKCAARANSRWRRGSHRNSFAPEDQSQFRAPPV